MVRITFAYLLLQVYEVAPRFYGFKSIFPRFDKTNFKLRAAAASVAVRRSRLEENMTKHITMGIAALAFGVAFASVPASAQTHYGKALNDGGMVDDYNSSATPAKPLYNSTTPAAPAAPHYGKALNDGGMTDEPSAAQLSAAKAQTKTVQRQTPPHYGKPMNDGGF
jgi:hypothetical protein